MSRATVEVAQQAGLQVASFAATGLWTPDSRICTEKHATDTFRQRCETMARSSFNPS